MGEGGDGPGPCGTKKLADIFRRFLLYSKEEKGGGEGEHRYEGTPTRSHYTVQ